MELIDIEDKKKGGKKVVLERETNSNRNTSF